MANSENEKEGFITDQGEGGHSAFIDTVHAAQGLGVIAVTYNWLAQFINQLGGLFMPDGLGVIVPPLFDFPLNPGLLFPVLWPIWHCIIIGFFTYIVIRWVCERKWIKVTYTIKECWQINPFGIIFCILKVVTVWFVVIICRWRYYIISVPIWFCFIIWVWRLF